ncbi:MULTISPECIES: XRE family transcriptional regulator [Xanthomonas]|uniref:Helix-turn-helix motif:Peptidase S24, S26A and S26B n=2 Tax=Xanthomonas TaxID=338 RepID=A0A7Z7NHS4_XANCH|nr:MULTISPECIES: helix-turn-helix transcriptional regulator [Xanthomonas]ATS39282.1 helix-turn-helix transcriptional regulator [Xanthomonas citri pv. phaseoli var. fuscans]ATS41911.1 helix-turn-helix transcriptional regulator [Xanthomonas citri pv. phaseoli var. fuscans]ATS47285.1 helix-turn-helix transcriptional regulator [Xanthomonas citri pv. phaseoli var. fuscans]ATS86336.1 helix-turn-helix transcriptional regulator [Xanthomonas citri pv. phaseoli var. fuscans]QWN20926.1 helix-turn-helix t
MDTIGSRVRRERELQGVERRELAAKTGVGYSTLSELERGGMQTTTKLRVIADALGVSLQWLETGKGEKQPGIPVSPVLETEKRAGDYVRVDQLDGDAGMGEGRINDDYPDVIRSMDLTPAYIRSVVGFVPPPGRLVLVTGRGDSMIPIIQPGESLIVDTGVSTFDGDGIYLINTGNGQQIKGLQDRGDAIYVVSANAALYPAFALPRGAIVGGKVYLRNRIDRLN